jgi:3D (Asp-Asp-Asp) domain-containing protein
MLIDIHHLTLYVNNKFLILGILTSALLIATISQSSFTSLFSKGSLEDLVAMICHRNDNTDCDIADNSSVIQGVITFPESNSAREDGGNSRGFDTPRKVIDNVGNNIQTPICSDDWYITGYYTPWEEEFPNTNKSKVIVKGIGERIYSTEFLKEIKIEGDGKTLEGFYIKPSGNKIYNKLSHSTDYLGKKMSYDPVTVAVDPKIIPFGSILTIPTLPHPWNQKTYIATDTGSFKGKHIDVWTGEGEQSKEQTYKLTGRDNLVCIH